MRGDTMNDDSQNKEATKKADGRSKCSHKGSNHPRAKLTEEQVIEMRKLRETGEWSYWQLGRKYHIKPATARNICKRKAWKHI
jgi:hypothetical protein